jgi:hypothetical protein
LMMLPTNEPSQERLYVLKVLFGGTSRERQGRNCTVRTFYYVGTETDFSDLIDSLKIK